MTIEELIEYFDKTEDEYYLYGMPEYPLRKIIFDKDYNVLSFLNDENKIGYILSNVLLNIEYNPKNKVILFSKLINFRNEISYFICPKEYIKEYKKILNILENKIGLIKLENTFDKDYYLASKELIKIKNSNYIFNTQIFLNQLTMVDIDNSNKVIEYFNFLDIEYIDDNFIKLFNNKEYKIEIVKTEEYLKNIKLDLPIRYL